MGIGKNNGDALSCIVLMLDSLASENESAVSVETFHDKGCEIFEKVDVESVNDPDNQDRPTSEEARQHLYSCTCDATIEGTFERGDGETLLVEFSLSNVMDIHPWLRDPEQTGEMIKAASQQKFAPLIEEMKPLFKKRAGKRTPKMWTMPLMGDDTVH